MVSFNPNATPMPEGFRVEEKDSRTSGQMKDFDMNRLMAALEESSSGSEEVKGYDEPFKPQAEHYEKGFAGGAEGKNVNRSIGEKIGRAFLSLLTIAIGTFASIGAFSIWPALLATGGFLAIIGVISDSEGLTATGAAIAGGPITTALAALKLVYDIYNS